MSQMHSSTGSLEFDLIDRLAKSLRVSGMKPGDMARALDVHRNTIGNYLNGRSPIDRRTLIAWAFACAPEITAEWLETGEGGADSGPTPPSGEPVNQLAQLAASKRSKTRGGSTQRYSQISAWAA